MYKNAKIINFVFVFCLLFLPVYAQSQTVKVSDFQLDSSLMMRQIPYRIALPKNYENNKNTRFSVIYLLHGLTGHYDNWGDKTRIAKFLENYNFIVVMPEGANGWYSDSATVPNDKYETYIVNELIPEVDKKFRTDATRNGRIIAGLSMGGYGAIKFGLKYPEKFMLAGSFSGALGAAEWTSKVFELMKLKGAIPDSIKSVYGADDNPVRAQNDIFIMVREVTPEKAKTLPFIYLDCGTEDFLIKNNQDFAALLFEKKIPHEYRQLPGAHTWNYWGMQIQEFLRLAERKLNQNAQIKVSAK